MNRSTKIILGLALFGCMALVTSCSNPLAEMVKLAKNQELEVVPNPLELHGDQVGFTMSAKLPVKMMKKGTKYTMEVSYSPANIDAIVENPTAPTTADDVKVGAIPFDGDKYVGTKEDPKVSKQFSFAYTDKLETGGLLVKGIASKGTGDKIKTKEFGPVRLAVKDGRFVKGIATTWKLAKSPIDGVNPSTGESPFAYADHAYSGPKSETMGVGVGFEKGSANLQQNTGGNKETMEMVSELFKGTRIPPFEATGTSSHSPEGSETVNTNLAEGRAMALETYFKKMLAAFKYTKDTIDMYKFNFTKKVLGETIPEFNSLVDGSSLSDADKSDAKATLGADGDFVEKEMSLHAKPYYNALMNDVYPQMRYAKTEINKAGSAKSLADMSAMTKKMMAGELKADALSEEEFLYVASNTPDLKEREEILKLAAQNYQTWKVHNNLGATYLDQALTNADMSKVDMAIPQFEASMGKKETGDCAYNMAMAYSMKGDNAKFEEYLQKSISLGSSDPKTTKLINGAKGYMAIKAARARDDGKYKEAEDILGEASASNPNLFNKGLAQLLQGTNYDAAMASFNSAAQANPKDAVTQYAMAICAARKGDESTMAASLKKSCELNADMKAKALKDVEFDKYKNGTSFKDAIK